MTPARLFDLSGPGAVVTGGRQGIGQVVAEGLAGAGAEVVMAARTVERLEEAVTALRRTGAEAHAVPTDVTSEESVRALAARALAIRGRIDVLVNNAGVAGEGAVLDM